MVSISDVLKHAPEFAKEVAKHLKSDAQKLTDIVDDAVHHEHKKHYMKLTDTSLLVGLSDLSFVSVGKIFKHLYKEEFSSENKVHADLLVELQRRLDKLVHEGRVVCASTEGIWLDRLYRLVIQR